MKCLFCQQEMWNDKPTTSVDPKRPDFFIQYTCHSIPCLVNNDFPRYLVGTDQAGSVCWQEYAFDGFYAKVSDYGTRIYKLVSCLLDAEVHTPDALWIDETNYRTILDRLRGLHYILHT